MASVPWGGSEILWSSAATHLAESGHIVSAAYPKWTPTPAALLNLALKHGVDVWEYKRGQRIAERAINRVSPRLATSSWLNTNLRWLKKARPDLLCISSGNATEGANWMRLAARMGIPFVTLAQAHVEFLWPSDEQAEELQTLFGEARKSFFVSKGNLRLLETQLGTKLRNIEVVSNYGSSLWGANLPWPRGTNGISQLACVGRLHPASKGQDLLIEVMAQPKWRGRPIKISCYGVGPQSRNLKNLVDRAGLQEKITFHGHVSDIEEVWCNHHALVMPSRYEGLPLALVEAMLCGRTAIVTDVAGNAELLEDGVTGFIAEAPTVQHLDRALEAAWRARNNWEAMGQAARTYVHQHLPKDPGAVFATKLIELAEKPH